MNIFPQNNNGNNGEILHPEDKNFYPLMLVSSLEPIQLKKKRNAFGLHPFEAQILNQKFEFNVSILRKEQVGDTFFTIVIKSLTYPLAPPEIVIKNFSNEEESKEFLFNTVSSFLPFKKAILVFDDKPYDIVNFQNVVENWRKDLNFSF